MKEKKHDGGVCYV